MASKIATVPTAKQGDAQRTAARLKANQARAQIAELKRELRSGLLDLATLLADPRAKDVAVLRLLSIVPRCTQRKALGVLLMCGINGADACRELTDVDRRNLVEAFDRSRRGSGEPLAPALDRSIEATRAVAPVVEPRPSEFAAARRGLESDPQLLRMIDRMVWALRIYRERDDGGLAASRVLEQWIRFRNYRGKVARGELPPPSIKSLPEVE